MNQRNLKHHFSIPRAAWLALLLLSWLCLAPARVHGQTNPPSITGGLSPNRIYDFDTLDIFGSLGVSDGDNNGVSLSVSFTPSTLGTFATPLPTGFTFVNGFYTISNSESTVQARLRQLDFAGVANSVPVPYSSNVTFTISAVNGSGLSTNRTFVLQVASTNDAPVITPGANPTTNLNDNQSATPFINVTVTDADNGGTQLETMTVNLGDTNKGSFSVGATGFTLNSDGSCSVSGTPAAVTTAIHALVFQPTANRLPVGQKETNTFTIQVSDSYNTANNSSIRAVVTSINDAPTFGGINASPQPVHTGNFIQPFAGMNVTDPDRDSASPTNGQSLTLHVTLNGSLGYLSASGGNDGASYLVSNVEASEVTGILQSLRYVAPSYPLTNTNTVTLTITVNDGIVQAGTNVTLSVFTLLTPPNLSGTQSGLHVNDNTTIAPFSTVNIQSFNGNSITVIVGLAGVTNDAQGQLVNLTGFTPMTNFAPTLYSFTGPSEAATAAIRALLFQPTPNRLPGSTNETVFFSITVIDGALTNSDNSTSVIVTPVNDPPTIAGTSPLIAIDDTQTAQPFSSVLISDVDEQGQQQLSVNVRLDDAGKGVITNVIAGFATNSAGGYLLTGSPAAVTAIIRQLVFVPTPGRVAVGLTENTVFSIGANDLHGGTLTNSATTIRVAAVSGKPIVQVPNPQPLSVPLSTNILPFQAVSILDATPVTVSLQISNAAQVGFFTSNSVAASGFTNNGGGLYTFSGTASNATLAIRQLHFTPSPVPPPGTILNFIITVTDQVPNTTVANLAITLRQVPKSFIVTKTTDYDPDNSSVPESAKAGTLRKAIVDAGSNDHITFDIRSSDAGLPDYPATIRLVKSLVLNNNLTLDGPGADRLTISGDTFTNGEANVQLFFVNAVVTMNRLTFTRGHDSFAGGAFEVSTNGNLKLSYCAVTDCSADVWGGGIDVNLGKLSVDHCLIRGNSTGESLGAGGGGISIYSAQACDIANTTFSGNQQLSPVGLGGGALYAEAFDPGEELDVYVSSCTFSNNADAAGQGSSIRPNVSSTIVQLQNSIVADGQGKNLERDESGSILSLGGNISDDGTQTIFSAGGAPVDTIILDQPTDQINKNPLLAALADNAGPTWTYAISPDSPATNNAHINPAGLFYDALATDQRGYWRDAQPDVGAFELNASQRVIIEEIAFAPANTNDEFIEFYVPRDSTPLNLGGYQVFVGGVLRHTFTSQNLSPGEALVLFSHDALSNSVPSGVYKQIASTNLLLDDMGDTITLKDPASQVVLQVSYVGSFTSSDTNHTEFLTATNQSLVLSPQFQGVFLPYQLVVQKEGGRAPGSNELSGAGYAVDGTPLALGNFPPHAFDDAAATDAVTPLTSIPVLVNDLDLDSLDVLRVVGVGLTNGETPGVVGATNYSAYGALVIINTNGGGVFYDPSGSAFLRSLPPGSNVVDSFQYTILDSNDGVDHERGATEGEIAQNLAKATATVHVSVAGVNSAPTPQVDSIETSPGLVTFENQAIDFTTWDTLLGNDTDPNSDDNSGTLNIVAVHPTSTYANTLQTTSELGATVTLEIRFDRTQSHITYNPANSAILRSLAEGETVMDTFYYSVSDRYGAIGSTAVQVMVIGTNNPPTASPNTFATDEDTPLSIPVAALLGNDTDPDTGIAEPVTPHLTVTLPSAFSAQGASVQVVGTNVIYDPTVSSNLNALARKEGTVDTFTYTATDDFGGSSTAVVSVAVAGRNDAPVGTDDFYVTGEKTVLSSASPGVLGNDRDPDVNGLLPDDVIRTVPITNLTTLGGATVNLGANGGFVYDPQAAFAWLKQGETVNDTFSYAVMDHSLTFANDDVFSVQAGSSSNRLAVLANDAVLSQSGGMLSITGVSAASNGGAVAVNAQGDGLVYTPSATAGTETFTYTISDGLGGTDTASVTVYLKGNLLTPVADAFTVTRGTSVSLEVLANDTILPPSGAPLTIASVGAGDKGGTISVNGPGPNNQIAYAPNATNTPPFVETFSYVVTAPGSIQATGTVSVTVIDRAGTLTANDDSFTVLSGGGNNVLDVLGNDLILPGANTNLTIVSIQTNGVSGTVSINSAHTRLLYKPSAGVLNGPETVFSYTLSDGAGGTATANVAVQITTGGFYADADGFTVLKNSQANQLPVVTNDVILPNLGQNLLITAIGIGGNAPNHGGTVTISGSGKGLIYTPATNFTGQESFTYEITDGTAARAQGHVLMKVVDPSVVKTSPDAYQVARESSGNVLTVLKNDYVLPRTPGALTITRLQTNAAFGTVAISGSGSNNFLVYTAKPGFLGTDTFGYEVSDGKGNSGTNQVTVKVGGLLPLDDQFTVVSDSAANALNVLANDLLLPDTAGVRALTGFGAPDQGGAVTTNETGTLALYTPAPGFTGTEHFTYQAKDDTGGVVTGNATVLVMLDGSDRVTNLVTITLIGTNDPPVIGGTQGGWQITDKATVQPFTNVTLVDVDEHGLQPLTVTVSLDAAAKGVLQNLGGFTNSAPGAYTLSGVASNITAALRGLVFVPTPDRIPVPTNETTILTIAANDGYVTVPVADSATTVKVTSVNDAPTIAGTLANQQVYDRLSLRPFVGVTIADQDNLTLQPLVVTITLDQPTHGYLTALGGFLASTNGVYSFTNATAAQATAAMRALVFVPTTASRLPAGGSETTRLTVSVNDGFAAPVVDNSTTVTAIDSYIRRQTASDGSLATAFASSVAAGLNAVIAGAPNDNGAVAGSGSATVYARNAGGTGAWGLVKKLVGANAPASGDQFGWAVELGGDTLAVGAPGNATNGVATGAVYIFDRNAGGANQWGQVKRLTPPDGASGDQFGFAVAVDGDTVVVGARQNRVGTLRTGSAYVFGRNQGGTNQWGLVKKVTAADSAEGDDFGSAVAINADTVVVGAQSNVTASVRGGSAYVFTRNQGGSNQWGQVRKLVAADAAANVNFGHSVAVSGDLVLAGAPLASVNGVQSGAAYAFARNQGGSNQWGQANKFTTADGTLGYQFGASVSVDGELFAIGANAGPAAELVSQSGATYLYARNYGGFPQWSLIRKITPPSSDTYVRFGVAVALGQGTLGVNALINDTPNNARNVATYIFRVKFDNAPVLVQPVADQSGEVGTPFNFALPAGTFADTDIGDSFTYSLGPVPAPPAWLSIDSFTGALSGTPTAPGTFPIAIVATDLDGQSRTDLVTITISGPAAPNIFSLGLASVQPAGNGGNIVTLQLNGLPGLTYRIQRAAALQGAATVWSEISTVTTVTNGAALFQDTNAPASSYYRASWP